MDLQLKPTILELLSPKVTRTKVPEYVFDCALLDVLSVPEQRRQTSRPIRSFSQTHPLECVTPLSPKKDKRVPSQKKLLGYFTDVHRLQRELFESVGWIRVAAVWTVVRLRRRSPTNRDSKLPSLLTKTSDTADCSPAASFNEKLSNLATFTRFCSDCQGSQTTPICITELVEFGFSELAENPNWESIKELLTSSSQQWKGWQSRNKLKLLPDDHQLPSPTHAAHGRLFNHRFPVLSSPDWLAS